MRLILQVSNGPEARRKFWLRLGDSLIVGRTHQSDFCVPSDDVMSSIHFAVENQPSGARIRDCGSTNGTFVNGQRIVEANLKNGDLVTAGKTEFLVTVEIFSLGNADAERKSPAPSAHPTKLEREQALPQPISRPAPHSTPPISGDRRPANPILRRPAREMRGISEAAETVLPIEPAELLAMYNQTPFPAIALPWENARGEGRLTVVIKSTWVLESNPTPRPQQLELLAADQPFNKKSPSLVRLESDHVPFKPRADIVVVGHVYVPGQRRVTQVDARLRVGSVSKTIRVIGDRRWSFPSTVRLVPRVSPPAPFKQMELTYAGAFGGIDEKAAKYCAENLDGVGFIGAFSPGSIDNKRLPNFEDPHNLIVDWATRPQPQGFGFYGRGWMPRLKYAGTFDQEYLERRSPLTPEDATHQVYNGAHPDLQVDGFLNGTEEVELENLSPHGLIQLRLPGFRPLVKLFRVRNSGDHDQAAALVCEPPVAPHLDTLVLLPDDGMFYLVHRVVFGLPSLDAIDVSQIHIDFEP